MTPRGLLVKVGSLLRAERADGAENQELDAALAALEAALPDDAERALARFGAMVLGWSPLECGFPTMPGAVIDELAVRAGVAHEDSGDGGHACWTAPGVKLAIARLLAPDGAVTDGPPPRYRSRAGWAKDYNGDWSSLDRAWWVGDDQA